MKLVNRTPVPAQLLIAEPGPGGPRIGTLVAKATFSIMADGGIVLDSQDPYPLFDHPRETEWGLLPSDHAVRFDDRFEVILLGVARAPGRRPITQLPVAMTVAGVRREIWVYGDRYWQGLDQAPERLRISNPQPFVEMPLTWERAFGGSAEILVDQGAPILVHDPRNPKGRGFDFSRAAETYREMMNTPDGYPRYPRERSLPNLEDPDHLIRTWDDAPDPACWATLPVESSLHALRSVRIPEKAREGDAPEILDMFGYQACSDWIIDAPAPGAAIVLEGLDPGGPIRFRLPGAGLGVDYVVGERKGSRELAPHMLVILAEEKRFYIVYRLRFHFDFEAETERTMRLRLDEALLGLIER